MSCQFLFFNIDALNAKTKVYLKAKYTNKFLLQFVYILNTSFNWVCRYQYKSNANDFRL